MKRRAGPAFLALSLFLATSPAVATTITVTGTGGAFGVEGADGNPGANGIAGGDGESVLAIADGLCEVNSAIAIGGYGGSGGAGGDGIPAGADGGDGGDGGNGGSAIARAIGTCGSSVTADATGGMRGFQGPAGSATSPGSRGQSGISGIDGDSIAEATLDTDLVGLATASAFTGSTLGHTSRGGNSAASSSVTNVGGGAESTAQAYIGELPADYDATATATAAGSGDGAVTASAAAANQGSVLFYTDPARNGDATAAARGTSSGGGVVTVESEAFGIGNSTVTVATAYGSNAGTGAVDVTAQAVTSNYSPAGRVEATAEGHSTGGGDVSVNAIVYRGFTAARADLSMIDSVSGSTSGRLALGQWIDGRYGEGDVVTSLHGVNPGGGDLALFVRASGGLNSDTVLGDILATSTTSADVSINVSAGVSENGRILQENRSDGAPPTPARIYGESNGGAVTTTVWFGGGAGRPGASVDFENIATGDTTGVLTLDQTVNGGDGQAGLGGFSVGSGGSARSALSKHTSSAELELRSTAHGGDAGIGEPLTGLGGDAIAIVDGSNSAGVARVFGTAVGGAAGEGGIGGNAVLEASAVSTGDGNQVIVGEELFLPQSLLPSGPGAWGGYGGRCAGCPATAVILSRGGDASSHSSGTAAGDSLVTVIDYATGGIGGGVARRPSVYAAVGTGGDASSVAIATGGGTSAVKAKSNARGGNGGARPTEPGGDADANASATGLGLVEAWARATGGGSEAGGLAGSAIAHATANGASGFARAEALTGTGDLPQLRAQSEALVGSRRDVAAAATSGAALVSAPSDPGLEGSSFFTSAPLQEDVDAARAGNAALSQAFASGATTNMLALARWTGDASDGPLTLSTDLELVMSSSADAGRPLVLGAFDTSVIGDGFTSLSFSLEKNGLVLTAQTFDTIDELMTFFVDQVFDLGSGWTSGDKLIAHFDLALGADTRFGMSLGYLSVPEPGTGLLLVFGLVLCAIYRVTSNPVATRSHVAGPTPRSRSANFCTRPVGVCGSSLTISR